MKSVWIAEKKGQKFCQLHKTTDLKFYIFRVPGICLRLNFSRWTKQLRFFFFFKGLYKAKHISLIFSHDNFFLQFPEYPRFWEKFHICWSLFWAASKPCSLFQICTHIFPVWVQSGTELTEPTVLLLLANIYQIQQQNVSPPCIAPTPWWHQFGWPCWSAGG